MRLSSSRKGTLEGVRACLVGSQCLNPRFLNELLALQDLGASVCIVCPRIREDIDIIGNIERFWYPKIKMLTYGLPINPPFIILVEALRARAQIYHVHDFRMIAVALFLKLLGKKVIYEIGDDNPSLIAYGLANHMPKRTKKIIRIIESIIRNLEKCCLRFFDCTVTITDWLRKDRTKCARKIFVLSHYPFSYTCSEDQSSKNLNALFGEKSLVYVGQIDKAKGINEDLIRILGIVSKDIPSVRLVIIGSGDKKYTSNLVQLARECGVSQNIAFLGSVAYPKLAGFLGHASIGLVLLTPICYSYSIGLPLKMLDMMACGVPVIVQRGMLEAERIVKESGCGEIVDSRNHTYTANLIAHILQNEEYRQGLGKNGLLYVRKGLSKQRLIDKIAEIYETL